MKGVTKYKISSCIHDNILVPSSWRLSDKSSSSKARSPSSSCGTNPAMDHDIVVRLTFGAAAESNGKRRKLATGTHTHTHTQPELAQKQQQQQQEQQHQTEYITLVANNMNN